VIGIACPEAASNNKKLHFSRLIPFRIAVLCVWRINISAQCSVGNCDGKGQALNVADYSHNVQIALLSGLLNKFRSFAPVVSSSQDMIKLSHSDFVRDKIRDKETQIPIFFGARIMSYLNRNNALYPR